MQASSEEGHRNRTVMIRYHVDKLATVWKILAKKPGLLLCFLGVLPGTVEAWPFAPFMVLELFARDPFVWLVVWPLVLASPCLVVAILNGVVFACIDNLKWQYSRSDDS